MDLPIVLVFKESFFSPSEVLFIAFTLIDSDACSMPSSFTVTLIALAISFGP